MSDEKERRQMSPEEFRRVGHLAVDWVADYLGRLESFAVGARARPGETYAAVDAHPPRQGEPLERLLGELDRVVLPGITHWQSPSFFGFFPANASGPAIVGDLISSGLGVQGMLWATSPACTEIETRMLDWLVEMLGLPERFLSHTRGGGVIQDSASSATLCALIAARERISGGETNRSGASGGLTAYASVDAHSSVEKAMRIAGLGSAHLRLIEVGSDGAMSADALARAIAADRAAGMTPCFVCATVGTTSSGAVDPVAAIGAICRREQCWLHVDAAMFGAAALCPELRPPLNAGLELVDSYCFNAHKWMLTNFDCDCFWVADRQALTSALAIEPEYLRNAASESGEVFDYRDWQVPLGRRFRALKLWAVIRYYGVEGLRQHVRCSVAWAEELAGWIEQHERFELAAPRGLSLVCFRHVDGDSQTERILAALNDSGALYLTHTRLHGRLALRLALGGTWTERRHVVAAWKRISALA